MDNKKEHPIEIELMARLLVVESFVAALVGEHLSEQNIANIRHTLEQSNSEPAAVFAQAFERFATLCKKQ